MDFRSLNFAARDAQLPRTRIDGCDLRGERIELCAIRDVALAEYDRIRHRRLLDRLRVAHEVIAAVNAVGDGDHGLEFVMHRDVRVSEKQLDDRNRIGEAGHLDQHAVEITVGAAEALRMKIEQAGGDLVMHVAAEAAAVDHAHAIARRLDQHVVDADLAVFVDDDRRARKIVELEQAVDQSGLAAAKKAGDQQHRHARGLRSERRQNMPPVAPAHYCPASIMESVGRQLDRSSVFWLSLP